MTQGQLADELGISRVRWQQLELGQRPLPEKHALRLQEVFGISAVWLLAGDLKASPVARDGRPYSKAIAGYHRKLYVVRVGDAKSGPSAMLANNLAVSLEALVNEIRASVIRCCNDRGLVDAVGLFANIRDAVVQSLKGPLTAPEVVQVLQEEGMRLLRSENKVEQTRLDDTRGCLGMEDLPIRLHDGQELHFLDAEWTDDWSGRSK